MHESMKSVGWKYSAVCVFPSYSTTGNSLSFDSDAFQLHDTVYVCTLLQLCMHAQSECDVYIIGGSSHSNSIRRKNRYY